MAKNEKEIPISSPSSPRQFAKRRGTRRQSLQRRKPPSGFTSRLRRETLLQRWFTATRWLPNALPPHLPLLEFPIPKFINANIY